MDIQFRRRGRESSSPDRAKVCMKPRVKPIKKVQIVYYLSRNGHLEHPHYMEVTHLASQPLRLKDVINRLTLLRGQGMPSLYSWSCKRRYKNGYVWNDLAENDIIYPSGAEYVLKGSELVEAERLQMLQVSSRTQNQSDSRVQKPLAQIRHKELEVAQNHDYEDEEEDYFEDEEKICYTSSTTPHSRCSRGVSTDELEEDHPRPRPRPRPHPHPQQTPKIPTKLTQNQYSNYSSPLSNNPSSITGSTDSNKSNNRSTRFEGGDPVEISESERSRNSVLLQFIACGGSAMAKAKNSACVGQQVKSNISSSTTSVKRSGETSLRKGVVCKSAVKILEEELIKYMSENPRFGNLQSEEKEYFSGSIVESMTEDRVVAAPVLKKSNSYNEERSTKAGLGESVEEKREKDGVRGKCIPIKKSSCQSKQPKK